MAKMVSHKWKESAILDSLKLLFIEPPGLSKLSGALPCLRLGFDLLQALKFSSLNFSFINLSSKTCLRGMEQRVATSLEGFQLRRVHGKREKGKYKT